MATTNTPSIYEVLDKYHVVDGTYTSATNFALGNGWPTRWVWFFFEIDYMPAASMFNWFKDAGNAVPNGVTSGSFQQFLGYVPGPVIEDFTLWDNTVGTTTYQTANGVLNFGKGIMNAMHSAQFGKKARSTHWKDGFNIPAAGGHDDNPTGYYRNSTSQIKMSDFIGFRSKESGTSWTGGDNIDETVAYHNVTGQLSLGNAAV